MKYGMMLLLSACVAAGGCMPDTSTRGCPTVVAPLETVVTTYNTNASAVNWLSAKVRMSITVQDPKGGLSYTWGGLLGGKNGKVLFEKNPRSPQGPHYFALVGQEASRQVFWVGVSPDEGLFYLWFNMGDRRGAWAGQNALAGAPGQAAMPLDPLGMVSLLNFTPLPWGAELPIASMRVEGPLVRNGQRQPPSYVLTYIDRQPGSGRPLGRREIYFEWTEPAAQDFRKPYKIMFFSPDGRRIMTATLRKYQIVPDSQTADGQPAVMPTEIELESIAWPGVPTVLKAMSIVLTEFHSVRDETSDGNPQEAAKFWDNLPFSRDRVQWIDSVELEQKGTP